MRVIHNILRRLDKEQEMANSAPSAIIYDIGAIFIIEPKQIIRKIFLQIEVKKFDFPTFF